MLAEDVKSKVRPKFYRVDCPECGSKVKVNHTMTLPVHQELESNKTCKLHGIKIQKYKRG